MILPYLATVLLALATVYSAVVSFRQRPDNGAPDSGASGWIFPNGVKRSARIFVGIATLALVTGLVWLSMSAGNSTRRPSRFLIPGGYTGWVRVEFEIQGAPPLPVEGGQNVLKIPPGGLLRTSSPEQYGWAKDSYYFYSNADLHPLPDSGSKALIWGKINGEASGTSGKRKYQEFFAGTEQQFKEQAGEKTIGPKPMPAR